MRQFSAAVVELEQAVDALRALADARGQGEDSLPLVVFESDTELKEAVARELAAHDAVRAALDALRSAS